jgi:peptidyl-prolyl cis-trans isomerase C
MKNLCLLVVATTLALAACDKPKEGSSSTTPAAGEAQTGDVIASYSGKQVTSGDVLKEIERLPAPSRAYLSDPQRKRQFVENMALNDLLFLEGSKSNFDKDPEIDRQVTDLRKRLVVQRVMRQYQTPPEISNADVQKQYDDNPNLYSTTQVKASHILVKDEATAKGILAELKEHPEKFETLAQEKSIDTTTAKKGGDLGMFGQGRMVPEFEKVAFALKVGELSDVVKTQFGYHIIKVTDRKEGERKPLDQVKEQIRASMRNKAMQDRIQGHYEQLKKDAGLKIDEDALAKLTPPPPPAVGAPGTPGAMPVMPAGH